MDTIAARRAFEGRGWVLLDEYRNSSTYMQCRCPQGHSTTISWNNFQKGQGCRHCAGNVKFSFDEVKAYFESQGCELLETSYERSVVPLQYRCVCGTVARIDFGNFRQGRRCQNCKAAKLSENNRQSDDDVRSFLEDRGHRLVRCFMHNHKLRIEYQCKCGELAEAYYTNFKRYPNCKRCGAAKISGDKCWMWNPDREAVAYRKTFRKRISNMLARLLKATGQQKLDRTHIILGYTAQQLQDHILNHPDYKPGVVFHIDHIFPVQAFLDAGISDLKVINCLENLRPMPGMENLSKADKYNKEEFEKWLGEAS